MRFYFFLIFAFSVLHVSAQQKKPLTHKNYDGWKSVGERYLSNNGQFAVYAVNPQEGDGQLYFHNFTTGQKTQTARGSGAVISSDSKLVFYKVKPAFATTRQARIKKKKPDEMPKDSLFIRILGTDSIIKIPNVMSFRVPEKAPGWIAYRMEKTAADSIKKKPQTDSLKKHIDGLMRMADSVIRRSLDSVKGRIEKEELMEATQKAVKQIYKKADELITEYTDAEGDEPGAASAGAEGTELVIRNTNTGKEKRIKFVTDYGWDKFGNHLFIKTSKNAKDTNSKAYVMVFHTASAIVDTIMAGVNDSKTFAFDEEGKQLAFVAERDSSTKSLQKFYRLWYYTPGSDSARKLIDRQTPGMQKGFTVSEHAELKFSKNGNKLFFGATPVMPAKDTNIVEFETAKLDIWHYNDDYIQPQQLKQLQQELKRSYIAVTRPGTAGMLQLGADSSENITLMNEGNADHVLAQSSKGNRIAMQWEGRARTTAYLVNTNDGSRKLITRNALGNLIASPGGKYIYWYDPKARNYFTYNTSTRVTKNISDKIKTALFDTENDVPDFPASAGTTGWTNGDQYFLINDEHDIWQTDPDGINAPVNITNGFGRKNKLVFDYVRLDPEKRFLEAEEKILLTSFDKKTKSRGYYRATINKMADPEMLTTGAYTFNSPIKAKESSKYIFIKSDISSSELFASDDLIGATKLTDVSSQQKNYNWLTSELVRWKMFDGKMSEGILYKPENFDPNKKYPVIFYFYERNADQLHSYKAPAPSASTINIPYFVSNGYIVFDPNIYYKTGEPGASAYNSVVSAAKYLSKMPWVDSTRMAIQGQSWGGYQVAYLVTRTNMFRAAGAGAPVSNMTSAYGGVRWGAGISRQFQYEKTQSRLGATLWERPDLYIKNSPLFSADKIQTPLLLMHNDADGAVPWYQSIELFTALKRLNKKVWLLQYNGEDHNLVERKNRKDLSVRLSQFFDYWLKDAKPADWIRNGLPATQKGMNWGLKVEGEQEVSAEEVVE